MESNAKRRRFKGHFGDCECANGVRGNVYRNVLLDRELALRARVHVPARPRAECEDKAPAQLPEYVSHVVDMVRFKHAPVEERRQRIYPRAVEEKFLHAPSEHENACDNGSACVCLQEYGIPLVQFDNQSQCLLCLRNNISKEIIEYRKLTTEGKALARPAFSPIGNIIGMRCEYVGNFCISPVPGSYDGLVYPVIPFCSLHFRVEHCTHLIQTLPKPEDLLLGMSLPSIERVCSTFAYGCGGTDFTTATVIPHNCRTLTRQWLQSQGVEESSVVAMCGPPSWFDDVPCKIEHGRELEKLALSCMETPGYVFQWLSAFFWDSGALLRNCTGPNLLPDANALLFRTDIVVECEKPRHSLDGVQEDECSIFICKLFSKIIPNSSSIRDITNFIANCIQRSHDFAKFMQRLFIVSLTGGYDNTAPLTLNAGRQVIKKFGDLKYIQSVEFRNFITTVFSHKSKTNQYAYQPLLSAVLQEYCLYSISTMKYSFPKFEYGEHAKIVMRLVRSKINANVKNSLGIFDNVHQIFTQVHQTKMRNTYAHGRISQDSVTSWRMNFFLKSCKPSSPLPPVSVESSFYAQPIDSIVGLGMKGMVQNYLCFNPQIPQPVQDEIIGWVSCITTFKSKLRVNLKEKHTNPNMHTNEAVTHLWYLFRTIFERITSYQVALPLSPLKNKQTTICVGCSRVTNAVAFSARATRKIKSKAKISDLDCLMCEKFSHNASCQQKMSFVSLNASVLATPQATFAACATCSKTFVVDFQRSVYTSVKMECSVCSSNRVAKMRTMNICCILCKTPIKSTVSCSVFDIFDPDTAMITQASTCMRCVPSLMCTQLQRVGKTVHLSTLKTKSAQKSLPAHIRQNKMSKNGHTLNHLTRQYVEKLSLK